MGKRSLMTLTIFTAVVVFALFAVNMRETNVGESLLRLDEKWSGDFDGMVERHVIRALVPYSKTFYSLDGADQRGLTYDAL